MRSWLGIRGCQRCLAVLASQAEHTLPLHTRRALKAGSGAACFLPLKVPAAWTSRKTDIHHAAQLLLVVLCYAEDHHFRLARYKQDPASGTHRQRFRLDSSGPSASDTSPNACDLRPLQRCQAVARPCRSGRRPASRNLVHRSKADSPIELREA